MKCLKVARELKLAGPLGDRKWVDFVEGLKCMDGLKKVDFTCWSETGRGDFLPSIPLPLLSSSPMGLSSANPTTSTSVFKKAKEQEQRWKNWSWTHDLLRLDGLREVSIKTWIFRDPESKGRKLEGGEGKEGFDYWLACRMVSDQGLRGRAVWDGVVEEDITVLRL